MDLIHSDTRVKSSTSSAALAVVLALAVVAGCQGPIAHPSAKAPSQPAGGAHGQLAKQGSASNARQPRREIKSERERERERESGETKGAASDPDEPFDQPQQAEEFEAMKRRPVGSSDVPVERYLTAKTHNAAMPQYSSTNATAFASQNEIGGSVSGAMAGAIASWNSLGPGNIGGRIRAILIDPNTPNTMYVAGVAGGVWKSTNGGGSWSATGDLLPNLAVNSMAMDPNNSSVLYAGTGEGYFNGDAVRGAGIFKSVNAGVTWTALANTTSSPDFYYVNKIAVSKVNSSHVYAATKSGIWRSMDGGNTWTWVLNSTSNNGCFDLAMRTDQTTDYIFGSCGTGFGPTYPPAQIYRNTDAAGTGTWTSVYTETKMGLTSLAIAPSNQNIIYAMSTSLESGNYNVGLLAVFRSTSSGNSGTWTAQVRNTNGTLLNTVLLSNPLEAFLTQCGFGTSTFNNQGWYDNIIAVDPADSNTVWAGGIDLFR